MTIRGSSYTYGAGLSVNNLFPQARGRAPEENLGSWFAGLLARELGCWFAAA